MFHNARTGASLGLTLVLLLAPLDAGAQALDDTTNGQQVSPLRSDRVGFVTLGVDLNHPDFGIDSQTNTFGLPIRFFNSRQIEYLGWDVHMAAMTQRGPSWGTGFYSVFGAWRADYWLNWEVPDAGAFDPVKSELSSVFMELGPSLYLTGGPITVAPQAGCTVGLTQFVLKFEDWAESDWFFNVGASLGGELHINPWRRLLLSVGYRRTLVLRREHALTVEDGVTFTGKFESTMEAFYLGVGVTTSGD